MSFKIILASNSPRRKELLTKMGLEFELRTKAVNEDYPNDLSPIQVAEYLAKKKSSAYRDSISKNELIITADTIVSLNGKILTNQLQKRKQSRCLLFCRIKSTR